jgi:signal transduction histidine kinase
MGYDEGMSLQGDLDMTAFDDKMDMSDGMGSIKGMASNDRMSPNDLGLNDGMNFDDSMAFEGDMDFEDDPFEYRQAISVPGGYLILGPQNERLYNSRTGQVLDELDFYGTSLMFACMLLVNALLLMGWTRGVGRLQKLTKAFATGDLAFRIQERGPEPLRVLISNMHQMATQLDQAEKQQQVMMNALPHELRTPLARVRMACDMLQVQPEQQEKWLGRAQQYLDDMEHLVQALLRLNRIASQQLKPDAEPVDLVELTAHLVEQESQHDPRVHSHLIDDNIKTLPVIGDRELISVVISNLIMNACRYSQTEVLVRVEKVADKVLVSISDDGKGFPEEQIAHLLQPFNRGDENRSRTSGGFGLGLAIVDVIIRAHHGRVQLSNLPEGGACVQFELPLVD